MPDDPDNAPDPTRLSRRSLLTGSGVAALGLAGAAVSGYSVGSRDRGGTRPERREVQVNGGNGMNVVVVVVDTVRRDEIGAYGGATATPNLDALAATSTRFTSAYPEMLPTIPVRRAVYTGQRSYPAREWGTSTGRPGLPGWQPIPHEQTTLAEVLSSAGYTTALLADTPHLFTPGMNFNRGFDSFQWKRGQKFDDYRLPVRVPEETAARYVMEWIRGEPNERAVRSHLRTLELPEQEQPVARLFRDAADLLDDLAEEPPFLLVLDTFEPHEPWMVPPGYVSRYGEERFDGVEPVMPAYGPADAGLTERELERMQVLYSANLTYTDRWLGHFLDALTERGLDGDTLVCVTSDHGIMLGEHGLVGKPSAQPYPEVTDLLMLVRHPERGQGAVDDRLAGDHDLGQTIVSALDLTTDKQLDGADLLAAGTGRPYATALYAKTLWVRNEGWLLIGDEYGDDSQLFDVRADPGLERDLAGAQPDVVRRLINLARRDAGGELPRYEDAVTL